MQKHSLKISGLALATSFMIIGGAAIAPAGADEPAAVPAPSSASPSPAPAAPAAPAPVPAPNYGIQTSGLVDGYFQYDTNNPKTSEPTVNGRSYDVRNLTPTLSLAELNVWQTPKPGGLGWKTTLIAGDTADINHGGAIPATGQEARYKNIQQLYGSYAFGGGGGVDLGKFYTPFGYEVTESNANYNYSRSLAYFTLPVYHAGVRIYSPTLKGGVTFTGWVVNSLEDGPDTGVYNRNGQAKFIGQVNLTDPKGKYVAIETYGMGTDRFTDASSDSKDTVSDTDLTYNFTSNTTVGLDYAYNKEDLKDGSSNFTTSAYAVFFRQQLNAKDAFALRYSTLTADFHDGTDDVKPWEITGTYEIKAAANFLTRFEYRHDSSNSPDGNKVFLDSNDNFTKSSQDTVSVSGVFTF